MTITNKTPPTEIDGTKVEPKRGSAKVFQEEAWIILIPVDDTDTRVWEFSLTTGKIIQTGE